MDEPEEIRFLVCAPAESRYLPRLISRGDVCAICGSGVWRAWSSPRTIKAICIPCFDQVKDDQTQIVPLTGTQARDLTNYQNRQKQ
jgi:hypothetical protein